MTESVEFNRVLAVMDPSQEKHPALRRVIIGAEKRTEKPQLTIFMAVDYELHEARGAKPVLYRDPEWFDGIVERIKGANSPYEIAISWSVQWAESVAELAKKEKVDRILVPVTLDEGGNHVITDEMWKLLRHSPVPVTLVHPGQPEARDVILAAVKMQDPSYDKLNKSILQRGKDLAEIYGAKLHVVNAYTDSAEFPDRAKLIEAAGVPNEQVHVLAGDSADVIRQIADKVSADLLLIGVQHRTGIVATLRGNTISKILRQQKRDVMSVV